MVNSFYQKSKKREFLIPSYVINDKIKRSENEAPILGKDELPKLEIPKLKFIFPFYSIATPNKSTPHSTVINLDNSKKSRSLRKNNNKKSKFQLNADLNFKTLPYERIPLTQNILNKNISLIRDSPIFLSNRYKYLNEYLNIKKNRSNRHDLNESKDKKVNKTFSRYFDQIRNKKMDNSLRERKEYCRNLNYRSYRSNNSIYSEFISKIFKGKRRIKNQPEYPKINEFITLQTSGLSDQFSNSSKRIYLREIISKKLKIFKKRSNPFKIILRFPFKMRNKINERNTIIRKESLAKENSKNQKSI